MKQLILLIAILVCANCFALSLPKHTDYAPTIKAFSSVWQAEKHRHAKSNKNDITIVYGGKDINQPSILPQFLAA